MPWHAGQPRLAACWQELCGYASAGAAACSGPSALLTTMQTALAATAAAALTDVQTTATLTGSLVLLAAQLGAADCGGGTSARMAAALHLVEDISTPTTDVVQLLHRALTTCIDVLQGMEGHQQAALLDAAPPCDANQTLGWGLVCAAAAALDAYVHLVRCPMFCVSVSLLYLDGFLLPLHISLYRCWSCVDFTLG